MSAPQPRSNRPNRPSNSNPTTPVRPAHNQTQPNSRSSQALDITGARYMHLEDELNLRRLAHFATVWRVYLEDLQYSDAEDAIILYIDLASQYPEHSLDIYAYYGLALATGLLSASEYLERIDMSRLSPEDSARIYLLRSIAALDQKQYSVAQAHIGNALILEAQHHLGIQNDCYYLAALFHAHGGNFVEADFYKTILPQGFALKAELRDVLRRSLEVDRAWAVRFAIGREIPSREHMEKNPTSDISAQGSGTQLGQSSRGGRYSAPTNR
ncbi:hypothetical protein TWF694_000910 [Orbilia ellipsospora]|uniref:Uncharacterized protein n=1 Tax=Orbilia ellipsospora TaxID=2528407 RepID=A0AAV9XTF5_9PEZI